MKMKSILLSLALIIVLMSQPTQCTSFDSIISVKKLLIGSAVVITAIGLAQTALLLTIPIKPRPRWMKQAVAVFAQTTDDGQLDDDAVKAYFLQIPELINSSMIIDQHCITPIEYARKNGRESLALWLEETRAKYNLVKHPISDHTEPKNQQIAPEDGTRKS